MALKFFSWIVLFLLIAFFYVRNLTGDIFGGDVGDLVTSALVGGVAHPPGYPLFLFFGRILGSIPFPLEPVSKVGLISVISAIGALLLVRQIVAIYIKNFYIQAVTVLTLAFSYLFWLYAGIPEVFMLNTLFFLCVVYFALRFYKEGKFSLLLIGSLIFGLSLSNHHTAIFTLPLCLAVIWRQKKILRKQKAKLLYVPGLILLGLTPYLYLLYLSSNNPSVNWNEIKTFGDLFDHFLRIDYGTFSAGYFQRPISEAKIVIVKQYFDSLFQMMTLPVVGISILGVIHGFRLQRFYTVALFVVFLISGPLFIAYAGFPLTDYFVIGLVERFYLFSFVILMLFFPFGLLGIYTFFKTVFSKILYAKILVAIFLLVPVLLFIVNNQKTDFSKTRLGTDLARNHLKNLPKDSILFLSGDTRSFNIWYVYFILKYRNDVELVQLGDFAIRSDIFDKERNSIKTKDLNDYEKFLNAVLSLQTRKPIYTVRKFDVPKDEYKWIPEGINFRLFRKDELPSWEEFNVKTSSSLKGIKIPYRNNLSLAEQSLILRSILPNYASMANEIGNTYYDHYTDLKSAKRYYEFAKLIDPTFPGGYVGLANSYMTEGECESSEVNVLKSIELDPANLANYTLWYRLAKECFKNPVKVKEVEDVFSEKFNTSPKTLQNEVK